MRFCDLLVGSVLRHRSNGTIQIVLAKFEFFHVVVMGEAGRIIEWTSSPSWVMDDFWQVIT